MITTPAGEAAPAASAGAVRLPTPRTVRLRDGRTVRIRPIRPSDAEALRAFDDGLCEVNHRFRYLGWVRPLTSEQALSMATVDFNHRFALVATTRREGHEVVVADCRLIAEPGLPAEIAIAVADDHHDVGLGPVLIHWILAIAADHGIEAVEARVRYDNEHMMHVLRRVGFERTAWESGVVTFVARTPKAERLSAAGAAPEGFLVQRMASAGVEVIVGVVQDPRFGPVVACGAGGTAVELLKDVSVRLAPLTESEAAG